MTTTPADLTEDQIRLMCHNEEPADWSDLRFRDAWRDGYQHGARAALAAQPQPKGTLAVWYGSMPESNGKSNWTAILHRGDLSEGHTIARSEYPDRVRYYADKVRWLIGELADEPDILAYDDTLHSGYVAPAEVQAPAPGADDARDAARWRTFIGLDYAIRAEWAANLSLAPVLTQWVDNASKEQP